METDDATAAASADWSSPRTGETVPGDTVAAKIVRLVAMGNAQAFRPTNLRAEGSIPVAAFHAVVRSFLRDDDVMGMAFPHGG